MSHLRSAIHLAHLASLKGASTRHQAALQKPRAIQDGKLKHLLAANSQCDYGKRFRFDTIQSVKQYQQRIPIVDYQDITPWINRIENGEGNVLTGSPVIMLEPSGGSTATNKYIPYTKELLSEFSAATDPWIHSVYSHYPLRGSRSYWSISLAKQGQRQTTAGVRIGFDDDTEYFDPLSRWALKKMMAVPSSVAFAADMESWRQQTCVHLLAARDLGLFSVWSPTYLTLLMEHIARHFKQLLFELSITRRAEILQAVNQQGMITGEALWPNLKIISTWTDSIAAQFLPPLQKWFPHTPIQGKGLLATEGVVSSPIACPKPLAAAEQHNTAKYGESALAVNSHFLEFIDLAAPTTTPLLAHELKMGAQYSPLLSTAGGLYRYHLKDVITCTGLHFNTPTIRFDGKLDRVSDVCGEKIHSQQVEHALQKAYLEIPSQVHFAMLSPDLKIAPPQYYLYIEADLSAIQEQVVTEHVENYLLTGHHYRTCRNLGQLGPVKLQRVKDGWSTYQKTLVDGGQRAGDIKPTYLDTRYNWREVFAAAI